MKTLCKYCWWKLTFVVRRVFICHLNWWRKQWYWWITVVMLMMLKLIIPALLEQGLLMSAVFLLEVSWGRGKRNKGMEWYPTHPRPAVATLPHTFLPLSHFQETDWAQSVACVIYAEKTSLYFYYKHQKWSAPWLREETVHLPVESVCPGRLASHLALSAYRLGDLL